MVSVDLITAQCMLVLQSSHRICIVFEYPALLAQLVEPDFYLTL